MPYLGKQPASVPVTADDIPNDSITTAKIVDAAITIADIGPNAVGSSEMADDAVGLNELSATGTTNSSTFLRGDNTWAVPPDNNTTYSVQDGELSQNNFTDADHTKLNGIAASANNYVHPNHSGEVTSTADGAQVIADNVVDEANLKVSNSPTNGQFLSAQSGNTGGLTWAAIPAGVGGATGVDFNDNVKIRLGTGNDAEIYHDGTHTYYKNSHASGSTRFNQKYFEVNNTAGTESMLSAYEDGAVTLRYDNSTKLATTADGATITGTTRMNGPGQTGGPASSGTTQVNTVAEFSGAGNGRLYVGTDTSSNRMWFQNSNPGSLNIGYDIHFQPNGGFVKIANFSATGASSGADFNSEGKLTMSGTGSGSRNMIGFYNTNVNVGNIITSGSSTSYSTSSDYRLKENVDYTWDATTRLKQLKPARFNFIADATKTVDGFLAHEVSSIVPEAVSGTKDEVDDDDNVVYQNIDQSKLVPLLVKAMQEQQTTIESLTARITALEG